MRCRVRRTIALGAALALLAGGLADAAQERVVYTSSVGLTRVKVAVLGEAGLPVKGLGMEDFRVREADVDRDVQVVLSPEDNALDVVLALDFSQSIADDWPDARESAHEFLDSLSVNDCVYLLPFNTRVGPGVWGGPDNPDLRRTVDVFPIGGATRLYDSMLRAYGVLEDRALSLSDDPLFHDDEELDPWPSVGPCSRRAAANSGERRRAIVLLTDGADQGSNARFGDILITSWHAEIPVFPVAVGMAGVSAGRWRMQRAARGRRMSPQAARVADGIEELRNQLSELARITGGQMVSQRDIRQGYDDVLGLLRGYYVIGYLSDVERVGWSEVEVKVDQDDLEVIVQPGVYRFGNTVQPALDALRRGRALFVRGDYEEALTEFDLAVALAPEVGSPFYGRGLVLEALERWEDARSSYLTALDYAPGSPSVQGRLADVSLHLGEHDRSWEYAVRARLAGIDVRGVMTLLGERSEPPFDLQQRLTVPVVCVLQPQVESLTALLETRDLLRTTIDRLDDDPRYGYTTVTRYADVVLSMTIEDFRQRDTGLTQLDVKLELLHPERGRVREESLRVENLADTEAVRAALTAELDELLAWIDREIEPREREIR